MKKTFLQYLYFTPTPQQDPEEGPQQPVGWHSSRGGWKTPLSCTPLSTIHYPLSTIQYPPELHSTIQCSFTPTLSIWQRDWTDGDWKLSTQICHLTGSNAKSKSKFQHPASPRRSLKYIIVSSVRSSNSHPDLLLTQHPLFQTTPVLNTGLSLSEPLQLYKGYNAI